MEQRGRKHLQNAHSAGTSMKIYFPMRDRFTRIVSPEHFAEEGFIRIIIQAAHFARLGHLS